VILLREHHDTVDDLGHDTTVPAMRRSQQANTFARLTPLLVQRPNGHF